VDEGRKRVLLIAATILAARKLAQFEGGRSSGDYERNRGFGALGREIMKAIDERWPAGG